MGKQLKGLLYFFITDTRFSLFVFWTILLSTMVVTLGISYFLIDISTGQIGFTLSIALYIYCAITGFLTVKLSIPFSIKVGATRRNIFISLGIFFFGLAMMMGLVANSVQSLTEFINKKIGIESFSFLHIARLMDTTWIGKVFIDASIMFFLLSLLFVIGIFFYKYGLLGGAGIVAVIAITLLVGGAQGWLLDFIIQTVRTLDHLFFVKLTAISIIVYSMSWFMIRKITIIK